MASSTPNDLAGDLLAVQADRGPIGASLAGLAGYDDRLPDPTEVAEQALAARAARIAGRAHRLDPVTLTAPERATEQRPSWGYQRLMAQRLAAVTAALDLQTGGGEVLAEAPTFPPTMAATEAWPPNLALATQRLHPRGVVVVADPDEPPLPFADAAFDLVTSRHPADTWWEEIARVLRPGGTYFAQHVGPESAREVYEFFLGPQPGPNRREPEYERAEAEAAGLEIVQQRLERLRMEFFDIGAVVYFLRKVIWMVPGFTVGLYRDRLLDLHRRIETDGVFVAHSARMLVEAHKPDDDSAE